MLMFDLRKQTKKTLFFRIGDHILELFVMRGTLLLEGDGGADCFEVVAVSRRLLIHAPDDVGQDIADIRVLYREWYRLGPRFVFHPLLVELCETLIMLGLLLRDLPEHRLTHGIFGSFLIREIKLSFSDFIAQSNVESIESIFFMHRFLLSAPQFLGCLRNTHTQGPRNFEVFIGWLELVFLAGYSRCTVRCAAAPFGMKHARC